MNSLRRVELFCRVVDNFGDIGVCWRLARQLVAEHDLTVRLWVDDLDTFARLERRIAPRLAAQTLAGVLVRRWTDDAKGGAGGAGVRGEDGDTGDTGDTGEADGAAAALVADCVASDLLIEAFGCGLPAALAQAVARRPRPPVWINLEYLSAEDWVAGCHGLTSPQPDHADRSGRPLLRHFFFPGFTADSGGLIAERGLLAARQAWQADRSAQAAFWRRLGLEPANGSALRSALFAYPYAPLAALRAAWAAGPRPVTVLVPEGLFPEWPAGRTGALTMARLPFLPQDDYDRLLWSCDLVFVRGEDSWVRALWAGRPLAWHIYAQEAGAHFVKLDAFAARWLAGLCASDAAAAAAQRDFWNAWNGRPGALPVGEAWQAWQARLPACAAHARRWSDGLLAQSGLATRLLEFAARVW